MATASAKWTSVGKNIEYQVDGDTLNLKIDMSESGSPSRSGKTLIIASTEGNKPVGVGRLGLNFYKYADAKPKKKGKK